LDEKEASKKVSRNSTTDIYPLLQKTSEDNKKSKTVRLLFPDEKAYLRRYCELEI